MNVMHLSIFEIIGLILLLPIAIIGISSVIAQLLILIVNIIINNLSNTENKLIEFILSVCFLIDFYLNKYVDKVSSFI